jgi:membrane-bound lytic murein transglycosylase F
MPGEDWRLVKAMCYQESLLNKMAVSHVGAEGLCQVMPNTFRFMTNKLNMNGARPFEAKDNIYVGVAYLAWIRDQWSSKRTNWQRMELTFASYNAGLGNVLKAQKKCGNSLVWSVIRSCMIKVTGPDNSKQTLTYVTKIQRWYSELKICQPGNLQGHDVRPFVEFFTQLYNVFHRVAFWRQQSKPEGVSNVQRYEQRPLRYNSFRFEPMHQQAWGECNPNGGGGGKVFSIDPSGIRQTTTKREKLI